MNLPKLLLVDDDTELNAMMQQYLQCEGFAVQTATNGEAALNMLLAESFALIVLDVMMPGISGTETLAEIRRRSQIPVLMLTAKGDDIDRIIGLELGADDYVPKPCLPRELVARIRAILRRSQHLKTEAITEIVVGDLQLWPQKRVALWHQQALALTSTEFNLLEALAQHAGNVVSKAELSELALGRPLARYDRSIDVHMSSIRQKLGQRDDGRGYIETVRGIGYQLLKD